jgi:hypothetical protein
MQSEVYNKTTSFHEPISCVYHSGILSLNGIGTTQVFTFLICLNPESTCLRRRCYTKFEVADGKYHSALYNAKSYENYLKKFVKPNSRFGQVHSDILMSKQNVPDWAEQ